jgi:preprotein translocase subunit SecY
MLDNIIKAFQIPEVRKRVLFTLGALIVFRIGSWIPIPGVDPDAFREFFRGLGGVFQFLNMFTGGALERFSLFALGVIPYINTSIIMSLLTAVIPKLKELQKQGEEGRRVINRYTRYGTVALAILQALAMSTVIVREGLAEGGLSFFLISVISLTTGTMFLMWLGERITENGIGRGISMIIMAGIIADYPAYVTRTYIELSDNPAGLFWAVGLVLVFVVVIAGVVLIQLGARKIEIQYAKQIRSGRVYGGHSTHVPLSVNQGGVLPIIFASALVVLPSTFIGLIPQFEWLLPYVQAGSVPYLIAYALLIIFFTYFYSAIIFDPRDLADNLRKWGGFIPGIRPGRSTSDYIERILSRILLIGALFLASIALLPYVMMSISGLSTAFFIGGTSILIVVGVGVDLVKQIEAHMVERYYESFIKKGVVLGRKL